MAAADPAVAGPAIEPWRGEVPLGAAFLVPPGLPWLALAHSDVRARLVLHEREVETRVIFRARRHPYGDVALADLVALGEGRRLGSFTLVLTIRGRRLAFAAGVRERAVAARVLARLAAEGCPLSPRAAALLGG